MLFLHCLLGMEFPSVFAIYPGSSKVVLSEFLVGVGVVYGSIKAW